jgi:phage anti-repressor protein
MYQKQKLKEQVTKWLKERNEEYKSINAEYVVAQFNSLKL